MSLAASPSFRQDVSSLWRYFASLVLQSHLAEWRRLTTWLVYDTSGLCLEESRLAENGNRNQHHWGLDWSFYWPEAASADTVGTQVALATRTNKNNDALLQQIAETLGIINLLFYAKNQNDQNEFTKLTDLPWICCAILRAALTSCLCSMSPGTGNRL